MPDVDEINSNLGALEAQLEELSRLKGLVQTLNEREKAANEAVQAAERATSSSQEVIEKFEDASTRIEGAEVVERFEEMEDTIRRFEEAGSDIQDQVERLPEVVREPLSALQERLDEAGDNLGVLQNAVEQRLDRHHSEITDALSSAQQERDQTVETLEEIGIQVEEVNELLQEAQLKSRLETLQDTASNANQAAQNGLSRIDAVERSLSDTLDEHRRRQDHHAEELKEQIADLRSRISEFETSVNRILWSNLAVCIITLTFVGVILYFSISTL
jgi:chromosome segregation ATPase